ncbi:MAG: response regulator [Acidobacteriota bacterium]
MPANRKSLTILVADDDQDDREFIKKAWEKSRVSNHLRFVEDGEELTEYLNHTGRYSDPESAPRPAVILLDLNMPKKNGLEALQEIKANPGLRQVPVIVLTASQAEEDILRSYDLGANSYIAKPVTFEALVKVLRVLGKYWIEIVEVQSDAPSQSSMKAT